MNSYFFSTTKELIDFIKFDWDDAKAIRIEKRLSKYVVVVMED